jgi:outer membrane protein OmpA-like peptidoglycan-associated protein
MRRIPLLVLCWMVAGLLVPDHGRAAEPVLAPPPPFFATLFEPGSVKLPDSAIVELANVIDAFDLFNADRLLVVGFSDGAGDPAFNARLATGRAQTMLAVLVAFGFDPDRITAIGAHDLGLAPPIADSAGRAEEWNRAAYIYVDDTARSLLERVGVR